MCFILFDYSNIYQYTKIVNEKRILKLIKNYVFSYVFNSLTKISLKGQYQKEEPDIIGRFFSNNIDSKE